MKNYKGADRVMSLETFKTCVDKVPSNAEIAFSGFAEPFLNPRCMDMIEYAYENNHPVSLYTTLVGASLEDVKRLGRINFYDFVLHMPDKDMNIEVNDEYLGKIRAVVALNIFAINKKAAVCFSGMDKRIKAIIGTSMKLNETARPNTRAGYIKKNNILKTGLITCKRCGSALKQSVILPNGNVVLCCMDFGQKHVSWQSSKARIPRGNE